MFINPTLLFAKIVISLFIGVLFTQSGFDKILDFKGNTEYIKSVFEKTFLKNLYLPLLIIMAILETTTGIFCLAGAWFLYSNSNPVFSLLGLELAAIATVSLFAGQRIAKDYAGAASLVSYFILLIIGLFLFSLK